ncbi:MAG: DUF3857 and transglutaminase domain-containing protein [Pyrinomonadaceae bacterium]
MKRTIPIFALIVLTFVSAARADDTPQWLVEASKLATPTFEMKDVPAVVLRNEETVTVNSDGNILRTVRYAVRILAREGRREATARIVYTTDSEKVRDINAWLIRKAGQPKEFGKKETVDLALVDNDLYNEARIKVIDASDMANEGDVFGFETVSEEKRVFSQFQFGFQDDLPVSYARYTLNLPAGWRAEGVTFNRNTVEPQVSGSSYNWELRDLAPIKHEAGSPSRSSLAPRLAVSFFPTQSTATQIKTFANWSDVARWMSEIEDPMMTVDDSLAGKARDLTDNLKTELEKIRAIAHYVQQIQYISIQVGTGKGGGYRPHSATEIFAKSYGDCKDKANLMRAMLSVLKIQAYMVSITADDPTYVRAEWASPHQFNHCIIAVKVTDATTAQSVVNHPTLGRLLIFDPTDPYTPVGDIPEDEQGSLALIDHSSTEALTRIPVISGDSNGLERTIEAVLESDGSIKGSINESTKGQTAVAERARLRRLSAPDYSRMVEGWVARGLSGAKTTNIVTKDEHSEGRFAHGSQLCRDFIWPAHAEQADGLQTRDHRTPRPAILYRRPACPSIRDRWPDLFRKCENKATRGLCSGRDA